jgi:hypothetical protein
MIFSPSYGCWGWLVSPPLGGGVVRGGGVRSGSVLVLGAGAVVAECSGTITFGGFGFGAEGVTGLAASSSAGAAGLVATCFGLTGGAVPVSAAGPALACSGLLAGLGAGACTLGAGEYLGSVTTWPGVNAEAGAVAEGLK